MCLLVESRGYQINLLVIFYWTINARRQFPRNICLGVWSCTNFVCCTDIITVSSLHLCSILVHLFIYAFLTSSSHVTKIVRKINNLRHRYMSGLSSEVHQELFHMMRKHPTLPIKYWCLRYTANKILVTGTRLRAGSAKPEQELDAIGNDRVGSTGLCEIWSAAQTLVTTIIINYQKRVKAVRNGFQKLFVLAA